MSEDVYLEIAKRDGSVYTKWGPCFCDADPTTGEPRECIACENGARIDREGLDWDVEYAKAAKYGFSQRHEAAVEAAKENEG